MLDVGFCSNSYIFPCKRAWISCMRAAVTILLWLISWEHSHYTWELIIRLSQGSEALGCCYGNGAKMASVSMDFLANSLHPVLNNLSGCLQYTSILVTWYFCGKSKACLVILNELLNEVLRLVMFLKLCYHKGLTLTRTYHRMWQKKVPNIFGIWGSNFFLSVFIALAWF